MRGKLKSQIYWLPIWMWLLLFLSLNTSEHRASSVETPQKREIDERLHPYMRQGILAVDIATAISAKCSCCLSNGIQWHQMNHLIQNRSYQLYCKRACWIPQKNSMKSCWIRNLPFPILNEDWVVLHTKPKFGIYSIDILPWRWLTNVF